MHEYIDKHGNLWRDTGTGYAIIHSESEEGRKAGYADAQAHAKRMQEAAKAFDDEFHL